jgi:hypothetical protein
MLRSDERDPINLSIAVALHCVPALHVQILMLTYWLDKLVSRGLYKNCAAVKCQTLNAQLGMFGWMKLSRQSG